MKANHTLALAVSALLAFSFAAGDADAQRRLHSNPLRILDTKNPAMAPVVEAAPPACATPT